MIPTPTKAFAEHNPEDSVLTEEQQIINQEHNAIKTMAQNTSG